MAVKFHVATFYCDRRIDNIRWVRNVGPDGRIQPPQSVEEFMGIVSTSWANAEVISVTETGDRMTVIMRADADEEE